MPRNSDIDATAEQVTTTSTPVSYGTTLKADAANTDVVYVGYANTVTAKTAATTDGYPLAAGEEYFVPRCKADDVNKIWVIAGAANQQLFWDYA
jgi:hypothetical protein